MEPDRQIALDMPVQVVGLFLGGVNAPLRHCTHVSILFKLTELS
jgi:hypothetical protein